MSDTFTVSRGRDGSLFDLRSRVAGAVSHGFAPETWERTTDEAGATTVSPVLLGDTRFATVRTVDRPRSRWTGNRWVDDGFYDRPLKKFTVQHVWLDGSWRTVDEAVRYVESLGLDATYLDALPIVELV